MIKSKIIHPELLYNLARCGHKARILIADSNYSVATNASQQANVVYLNFAPGMISGTDILKGICELVNIELATMMSYPEEFNNTIVEEYSGILPSGIEINYQERSDFYSMVKSDETMLVIASGEQRRFANILLTVGVVT